MIARSAKKVRGPLVAVVGVALTLVLASELLHSRGKQPFPRAEWVEIGVATDGTRALVDQRSISRKGERVVLWQRFALDGSKANGRTAETVDQLVVYDCPARIVSTLESRELDGGGEVLRAERFRPPLQYAILAATIPEYIFDAVC